MKTKFKAFVTVVALYLVCGCSNSLQENRVYIVHEITEGQNVQYMNPFSQAINDEIKNKSVSWIHDINVYHTNKVSKERLYQLKIDMENVYDFSPNFINVGDYQGRQLLLWEVHVSESRFVNCQVWEIPGYDHFLMSDMDMDKFVNETACSSLHLW